MADKRPIIIIKKKSGHGGHHGGAWKVAYADFVTAMMALFIVLWLTSSGEKVKKSIAGYFKDPSGTSKEVGTDRIGEAENIPLDKKDISKLKERLQQQIASQPDLKKLKDDIEVKITPEGIRIELIESKDGTFFESGSSVLNATGQELLRLLASELGTVPNRVSLEGHTDAQQYSGGARYDNWELSTDRANSARRLMQSTGLKPDQLAQVRGFADQQPRVAGDPLNPSNRRISVVVHYLGFTMSPPPDDAPGPDAKPGNEKPGNEKPGNEKPGNEKDPAKPSAVTKDSAKLATQPTTQFAGKEKPGSTPPSSPATNPPSAEAESKAPPNLAAPHGVISSAQAWMQNMSHSLLHHGSAKPAAATPAPISAKPASE